MHSYLQKMIVGQILAYRLLLTATKSFATLATLYTMPSSLMQSGHLMTISPADVFQ